MAKKRVIQGVSVAGGLAIGSVHVVRATPFLVPTWTVPEGEIQGEIDRLHEALERSSEELRRRQLLVAQQTSEQDAEIFAVHRMLLQDPSALARVEATIREERINAEASVQALIRSFETRLGGLEAENLKTYASDFSDPWRLVLDALMRRGREHIVSTGERMILAAAELTPQVVTFLERERILAVVTETGGRFSHGAVLARSFGIPCVVGLPNMLSRLEQGMRVVVDGDLGTVQLRPEQEDVDHFLEELARRKTVRQSLAAHAALPAVTTDNHPLRVMVNIESLRDLDMFDVTHTDGIGLLRTEFLYMERPHFPSEEEQYRLYRRAIERMAGRPVVLRTLDIGGDKSLPYLKTPHEQNPVLGWRGLRITLDTQDIMLRVQLRAALRASVHGDLRILLPMVTSLEEVQEVHAVFDGVRSQLVGQGYEVAADVPVGIMIEVPSNLFILPELLAEVDFISVGTNDLVQYLLAVDRDNALVSRHYNPYHPAVMQALSRIAEAARAAGRSCSVCGEMAGDVAIAVMLLGMGYDTVSVAPNFLPEIKYAVRHVSRDDAADLARRVLAEPQSSAVREVLEEAKQRLHDRQLDRLGAAAAGQARSLDSEKGERA
jgi:phosphoenolpyruvate-protein phosphotransferase (PTS system enzyme I)